MAEKSVKLAEKQEEKGASKTAPKANQAKTSKEDYFANFDFSKTEVKIEDMFKSGVHFGHSKSRKNPKMDEYIFGVKNGISIFDLEKTENKLKEALGFLAQAASRGQEILFVGTKKQAKNLVESAAKKCEMPYVTERWLGGTFTNFPVISKRTKYLRDSEEKMKKGEFSKYTKFEQMKKMEEIETMERKMGGIKNMVKLPGAVFVTGVIEDELAVKEAKMKNVPIAAIADSNVDPEGIDYIIPANDDAISSLRTLLSYVAKAVIDGKEKKDAKIEEKGDAA